MKKDFKVTVGVIFLGMVTPCYAFYHASASHSALSFTGTYFQPSNNGASVGDYTNGNIASSSSLPPLVGRRAAFIDPDNQFGYAVGYAYHFPCTDTRLFLSYEAYRTHHENYPNGRVTNIEVGEFINEDEDFVRQPLEAAAFGRLEQTYDDGKIGLIHSLKFGNHFYLDLQGFFEWNKLTQSLYEKIDAQFSEEDSTFPALLFAHASRNTTDKMAGWGPGIGAMALIKPFSLWHWGFFLGANYSLLWVDNDYGSLQVLSTGIISSSPPDDYYLDPESSESVVGKLDINFGIDYCRIYHTYYGPVLFGFNLGLRYMNIFNALKNGNVAYSPLFTPNSSLFSASTGFAIDWGQIGPFFSFRLGGAEA